MSLGVRVKITSTVDITARLWARQFGIQGLAGEKDFSLLQHIQNRHGTLAATYSVDTGGFFPRMKWTGCEIDLLLQSVSRLKMSKAIPLYPHAPS
jgi:hypothetical protein